MTQNYRIKEDLLYLRTYVGNGEYRIHTVFNGTTGNEVVIQQPQRQEITSEGNAMSSLIMELKHQELANDTLGYIDDKNRKTIYLDNIAVTPDGKIYIVEIFSFENKPDVLITVNLVKPKQRDLKGLLAVRADSPIEVIKVFQPMVMKPCKSFVVSRSKHYEPGICVTGYLDNNKPIYSLDYNENSTFPRKKIEEQNSDIIKSYLNNSPAVKRITEITDLINGFVYSLFVETFTNSTCKLVLTKYSQYPVNLHNQIWSSEIITTECDMYSIELQDDNTVKVYGSRSGYNDYKTFHWDENGILLDISK